MKSKNKKVVDKKKRSVISGVFHIMSTFNNSIITVTDLNGDVVAWSSSGQSNFKGSRKSTPYAARVAAEDAAKKAVALGMKTASVFLGGPGISRESAVRAIAMYLVITSIQDCTGVPYNGCRPPNRRRV